MLVYIAEFIKNINTQKRPLSP